MAEEKELQSLPQTRTGKYAERFVLKRIDEQDIEISLEQRNSILEKINSGARFIQIDKYTLMVNSIKSIDPKWGSKNIPPRPSEKCELIEGRAVVVNSDELDEWDNLFSKKLLE